MGAELVLDTNQLDDWVSELKALTKDDRILVVIETTGNMATINSSVSVMGSSIKADAIRRMIKWWKDGKIPLERPVKFFDAKAQALHSMEGNVVKPVLVWY